MGTGLIILGEVMKTHQRLWWAGILWGGGAWTLIHYGHPGAAAFCALISASLSMQSAAYIVRGE